MPPVDRLSTCSLLVALRPRFLARFVQFLRKRRCHLTESSRAAVTWRFRFAGDKVSRVLNWRSDGPPDPHVVPIRKPRSSERHRHIPVTAYSLTMRDHLELESGLEHDLLRRLDRLNDIVALIPQPCQLKRGGSSSAKKHARLTQP